MLLVEENFDRIQTLTEGSDGEKKLYLEGVFSVAGAKNRNQRSYTNEQLKTSVGMINEAAEGNRHILGELDHPDISQVSLKNVSHRMISASVNGNEGRAKLQILEHTPQGATARALIESGVQLGVSTRGSGSINKRTGIVENYQFHTIDLVASPSCQTAYPQTLREQMEFYGDSKEIDMLSEEMLHDPLAKMYFHREIQKFMKNLSSR